jgi:type IV pilus assembly protein PilC
MESGLSSGVLSFFKTKPKVKSKELQIFARQFATMINSGIPIVQSLDILTQQASSAGFRTVLSAIKVQLESGKRLAECFQMHPQIFDRMFVNMVRAGEEGGVLDTVLNRQASYLEKNNRILNKVKGAMFYPAGVMVVAGIVIFVILKYVIPKFEKLFSTGGQKLPWLTQVVVDASHLLENYLLVIVAIFVGIISGLKYYYSTPAGREVFDRMLIRIPIFGTLIQKTAIARFTRTMSTMLTCGVGILESLEVCSTVVGNVVIENSILRTRTAVSDGKSIVQPLALEPMIPPMVVQMIGVGESTGTMDTMFSKIADFYEEEVDFAVGALTSIMEPILMIFLGGIVAILVIAMYLPIFTMGNMF